MQPNGLIPTLQGPTVVQSFWSAWLFPRSVRGFRRETPGKSGETFGRQSVLKTIRTASNLRISGTKKAFKGKLAPNSGSTLPRTLSPPTLQGFGETESMMHHNRDSWSEELPRPVLTPHQQQWCMILLGPLEQNIFSPLLLRTILACLWEGVRLPRSFWQLPGPLPRISPHFPRIVFPRSSDL